MRAKLTWLWLTVVAALAAVAAYFKSKSDATEQKKHGEELKAKVAEVKAEQAARKEATDVAVAQVDEAAKVDAAKDPVLLANELIADAERKG